MSTNLPQLRKTIIAVDTLFPIPDASSILPSCLLLENKNAAVPISSKCCTFSK